MAAMGIAQKISMVPLYIAMGIGQGIMPLVSYNYASGNAERMKKAIMFSLKMTVAFMTVILAAYYFGAEFWVELFMKNESIVSYGARFLRGLALAMPFLAVDFLGVGVYQACGMGRKSLAFAIMRKIVLEIPALFVLNKLFPLYGLAYAQFIAEFVLAIAAVVILNRIFRQLEETKK